MDRTSAHEQIATISEKISFLNEKLSSEKKLHPVELDLLNGYARELQGLVNGLAQLKPELTVVKKEEPVAAPVEKKTQPVLQERKGDDEAEIKLHQHILQKAEELNIEEDPEALLEEETKKAPVKMEAVEEVLVKKKPVTKHSTAEQVSLNEKFKKETTALADKLKVAKKKNLKDAFDLNERYKIIENLFKGSAEQFTRAIQDLGKCSSREEAELFFKNAETKFSWKDNPELAIRFKEQVLSLVH